jgi:formylmethanofuran dehydrogenase subunit D
MASCRLILITGRSTKQGTGISAGKDQPEYQEATRLLEMNRSDLLRLGVQPGEMVRIRSRFGETTVRCREADLPEGLAFLAYGPAASELIGGETWASGMPDTKGFEIEVEKAA